MKIFQIQKKSAQTADKGIEAKIGQLEQHRHVQEEHGKDEKETKIPCNLHPFVLERIQGAVENVVKHAARTTTGNAYEKDIDLVCVRHLNSLWKNFPFAPP